MYQHGKRTKIKSNPKAFLQFIFVLGFFFVATAIILRNDIAGSDDEKTTVPIVSEVAGASDKSLMVNEPLFSMKLPEDWSLSNRVQANYANYYEWRSSKKGGDDRLLRLHINIMPQSYKIVRMQPIMPDGNKLKLGNLSSSCIDFAIGAGTVQRPSDNASAEAKWENVSFICDPINNNQTIGTGVPGGGIGATMSGSQGQSTFFFYYEDHNIRPDDEILRSALSSFTAK